MREKIKNIFNNKKIVISLTITLVLLLALGATYAWWVWNSSDNTSVTIQIGNVASFYFPNGDSVDADITPIYNSCSEGLSIPFGVTNNYNATNKLMIMHVYFDIDYLPAEFQTTALKYQLLQDGTVIAEGNFSTYAEGDTVTVDDYIVVPTGSSTYTFYICLDGNDENVPANPDDGVGGTLRPEVEIVDIYSNPVDWIYILGTDKTTIDSIEANVDQYPSATTTSHQTETKDLSSLRDTLIIEKDEILLTSYIGSNTTVYVPNTMTVNGITYRTKLLTSVPIDYEIELPLTGNTFSSSMTYSAFCNNENIEKIIFANNTSIIGYNESLAEWSNKIMGGTFMSCNNLIEVQNIPQTVEDLTAAFMLCGSLVNAPSLPSNVTNMTTTFADCSNLVNAPSLPSNLSIMQETFRDCTSLTYAPEIPNTVTNMSYTFDGCANMTTAPSSIPVSVTNLEGTFRGSGIITPPTIPSNSPITSMNRTFGRCANLTVAPTIPNSVTDMSYTFWGCSSLVTPPTLPSTVTNMFQTFMDCTSLTIPSSGYTIPASVRNISNTFRNCTSLKSSTSSQVINFATTAATFVDEGGGPLAPFSETTQTITARVASCTSTTAKYLACNKPSNVSIKLSSGTACSPTATCPTAS